MSSLELFILAIGLSMDAFAVAVCKGLSMKKFSLKKAGIVGLYFGFLQAFMPLIGFLLGVNFREKIESVDHWIAFILLLLIGGNMIKESFSKDNETSNDSVSFSNMIVLAIATSIDALAVGITFACLTVNVPIAVAFIGVITFSLSTLGVKIGNVFGAVYKSKAEFAGGFILILLGSKILLEHLGFLSF
ncbi:manganese efflux pump MntP [Clostridium sp. Marseille-P299]|uniref:manganese efflux pump MntP n=1 Tax=Clostridium sp. Marseille-P299 TaxID=1805477 RepID=UPI00082B0582|nr:manganese efflux pump MntP family protein [Clostridium sp. Marseille-P299]